MADNRDQKSFWVTLPGVLTAIGTFIGAITALLVALNSMGLIGGSQSDPTSEHPTATSLADDLFQRGFTSSNLGQYQEALNYLQQALVIYQRAGKRAEEGNALINIGVAYNGLGQYNQALPYLQRALVIHREVGNRQEEAVACQALVSLGLPC
jgi:tetratricopeptide (TPR) repeat protein